MPMIDVYATAGTFPAPHELASDLARTLMVIEAVPDIPMFRQNTAAFIHDLPDGAISNVDGDSRYVRIQVLTNAGALDRDKQLAVVGQFHRPRGQGVRGPVTPGSNLGAADRGRRRRLGPVGTRPHQYRADPGRSCPDRRVGIREEHRILTGDPCQDAGLAEQLPPQSLHPTPQDFGSAASTRAAATARDDLHASGSWSIHAEIPAPS
jgi:hypothetical protein